MSMSINASCSPCCFPSSLSITILNCPTTFKTGLGRPPFGNKYTVQRMSCLKGASTFHLTALQQGHIRHERIISKKSLHNRKCFPVASEDFFPDTVIEVDTSDPEELPLDFSQHVDDEDILSKDSYKQSEEYGGKPGFVSFYNRHQGKDGVALTSTMKKDQNSFLWFAGPAILVASFILPSLYLRKIISRIFEDSLLTDFLILFFTEALFYCGVAVFLLIIHRLWRPGKMGSTTSDFGKHTYQIGHRISYVAILMLSLIIPMVTMGFVWPWTGPAASATLAPYLVGIVVQYAFEQYARYSKSPSWSVIPVVFQVYRLHQLNRAAQLVTALSFTVRGAEMTAHNLAINKSLGTLLNVLQMLGLISIWSLSSFLMRLFPSSAIEK